MAKTYLQPGEVVPALAPVAGVVAGTGVLLGQLFGIAMDTAASGVRFSLAVNGVFQIAKEAVQIDPGDTVFWNTGTNTVDKASAKEVGLCLATALAGAATVWVKLVPTLRTDAAA